MSENAELPPKLDDPTLAMLERTALRLARLAGARIAGMLGRPIAVEFKQVRRGSAANSNPVSELDREIEQLLRAELATTHPDHGVIGEELGSSAPDADLVWALDPIDGTTNFINALPLAASSVGVLWRGWPVAGAIWCATSHALRPGTYHARRGGALCFDGEPLKRRGAAAWRGLAAETGGVPRFGMHFDTRVLGSATLELAFGAAGLLQLTHLGRPALWDAVAGLVLIEAAGCAALTRTARGWQPLERFAASPLAAWCQPMLAGDRAALDRALPLLI
jgi:myo-inositol-1(or 4)-monophosphatase